MLISTSQMIRNIVILLLIGLAGMVTAQPNRSLDGFGNNHQNPEWGSAGSVLASWTSNGFHDSISQPGGVFRPNARLVSNQIFQQNEEIPDERNLTEYVWVFGQFIDHDITFVSQDFTEYLPIKVPSNDTFFIPGAYIPFFRSYAAHGSGEESDSPRKYNNEITSFIDASNVYGSDDHRANWLRTFDKGRLKTSDNDLLPWNTVDGEFNSPVDPGAPHMDNETQHSNKLFVAGDVRANEHPLLIAIHTVFMREHNRICDSLYTLYPHWEDEVIYQKARKTVGGIIQSIVYNEWLPAMGISIDMESRYDANVDPSISNVFSGAAFRLGHTLITDEIIRFTGQNDEMKRDTVNLKHAFFNPVLIPLEGGVEPYLLGIAHRLQQKLDCQVVDGVRNFLFGDPSMGGLDLAAMNIMRGRDRGLPDFNTIRQNMNLNPYQSFSELTDDPELLDHLRFLYGNVDNIDPWVGMLAEKHVENSMVGQLLYSILQKQFEQLRQGDRYYFEFDTGLTEDEKSIIRNTRFSQVIKRNSALEMIQDNVFIYEKLEQLPEGPELVAINLDAVAYPVPFSDFLSIDFYLEKEESVTITMLDLFGHGINVQKVQGTSGINRISWSPEHALPSGFYFVLLESGKDFKVLKLRKD